MSEYKELSCLAYDLRKKVVEMVVSGKGGHIGGDMSVIDVLVALYFKEMNISPENMDDPDRDRFVMSKGHSVEDIMQYLQKRDSSRWKRSSKNSPNSAARTSAIRTINCRASR